MGRPKLEGTDQRQREYVDQYQKEHITRVVVKLNDQTDQDILDHLDAIPEKKQTYIKRLIREDIEKER